ncbi:MAG: exodeoxyribonuclease VII large subunit [Caldicoprobacterales bacterium]|jgi:exodeoxyribonuclease VII large subunit|nr:exodeoxyribonuclease VII large subunit [Clostridiales bacterium]
MNRSIFTVSQVNNYVKNLMDRDLLLQNLWIRGEISNFKLHSSGHMYFTLKDDQSRIRCVFFRYQNADLDFTPSDGLKVILKGNISMYIRDGQYQFYVEYMEKDGIGQLYAALEALKIKLKEEGLFSDEYKKPLPAFPRKIAIITSHTGAAVHDLIRVITKRNNTVSILVIPVLVQGETAKDQISAAIDYANTRDDIDILIIGRGGGSIEELWAFNEEKVARAIFRSRIPIISAVGHETDFTVSDLVADVRAATPSAAGEIAVRELSGIYQTLDRLDEGLQYSISRYLMLQNAKIQNLSDSYIMKYPERFFTTIEQRLDHNIEKIATLSNSLTRQKWDKFAALVSNLEALNPLSVMMRGFCVLTDANNKTIINSVDQLNEGMNAMIRLIDGIATCNIISKEKGTGDEDKKR